MVPPSHKKATKGCTSEERKLHSDEGVGQRKQEQTKTSLNNLISLVNY